MKKNQYFAALILLMGLSIMSCKTSGLEVVPGVNNSFQKGDPRADFVNFKNTYSCDAQILGLSDSSCIILIKNNEQLKNSFYRVKLESNLSKEYCGLMLSTATLTYLGDNPELRMIEIKNKRHNIEVHFKESNYLKARQEKKSAVLASWVAFYKVKDETFNNLMKLSSQKGLLPTFREVY